MDPMAGQKENRRTGDPARFGAAVTETIFMVRKRAGKGRRDPA